MFVKRSFTFAKALKISLLLFAGLTVFALAKALATPRKLLQQKQAHLAVRALGDQLLRNAQEYATPVPPVRRIDEHTLRLSFPEPIPINPDSLSLLALRYLLEDIAPVAIVNVLDAASGEVVYGFEINHTDEHNIPCLGRSLPAAIYYVEVSLYEKPALQLGLNVFTAGLLGLLSAGLLLLVIPFFRGKKSEAMDEAIIQAKGMQLDLRTNQILSKDQVIKLTEKEAKIFSILLQNAGQLVSRDYLTEEVWLKEGVVTSRSLDMYISRLRKKVQDLGGTEIINERGKGYVLQVN